MGIISVLLLYIFLFTTSYMIGFIFPHKKTNSSNKEESSIPPIIETICYGFAYHIALFEVLFLPFYFLKTDFNSVVIAYIITLFIMLILFIIKIKKEVLFTSFKELNIKSIISKKILTEITLPFVLFIFTLLFQIVYCSYFTHTDADDGYMTTVSTIAYMENKINLSFWGVYDGLDVQGGRASIFCWEFFIAALSKIFQIHPAILNHSVIIGFLLTLCYMAVYLSADLLFNKERRNIVMLLYSILIMFCAYSTYSLGSRMLLRVWQGKNTMVGFLIPLFLHSCLKIYFGDISWRRFIINIVLIISGIGMTIIGVYFLPLTYAIYGLPLLIYLLYTKQIDKLGQILKKLILSVIPIIAIMIITFVSQIGKEEDGTNIGQTEPDWIFTFKKTFGDKYVLPLLIISLIILIIEYIIVNRKKDNDISKTIETVKIRLIFVAIPILMSITLLNPLLCNIISYHVTSVPVYWRLYWIIPIQFTIAVALSYIVSLPKKKIISYTLCCVMIILEIFSGTNMFQKDVIFFDHINYYMVPAEVILAADIITTSSLPNEGNHITAAFPADISYYVRQYDSRVAVIGSRSFQNGDRMIGNSDKNYGWLYDAIYTTHALDDPEVISCLNALDVSYIFIYGDFINTTNFEATPVETYGYLYKLK